MHLVRCCNGASPGAQRKFSLSQKPTPTQFSYDKPGPYGCTVTKVHELLPNQLKRFRFKATYPTAVDSEWPVSDLKAPVIFFYRGYEIPNSWYKFYCERLATWGYVVLQYAARFPIPPMKDEIEIELFRVMLDSLPAALGELPVTCDWESVATAGHSRGAKLALLAKIEYENEVKTVYMIDPVEGVFPYAKPGSPGYPDAIAKMKKLGSKLSAGIAGHECSIVVQPKYDYTHFWDEMNKGASSSAVLEKANHLSFCSFSSGGKSVPVRERADRFWDNDKEVVEPTSTLLVHWMQSVIATPPASSREAKEALERAFRGWLSRNENLGLMKPLKP